MPTMPQVISKGPILIKLDAVLSDTAKRDALLVDLEATNSDLTPKFSVATIAQQHGIATTPEEVNHLRNDWFQNWWPNAQPTVEKVVRGGLIEAIRCASMHNDIPIDCYWVCDPGHGQHPHVQDDKEPQFVEVSTSWNDRQATMIIYTPHPPDRADTHAEIPEDIVVTRFLNGEVETVTVMRHV